MKKLLEFNIEFEKTPKKIGLNEIYYNRKQGSGKRGRGLVPEAIAYKNKIIEVMKETKIKSGYGHDFLFDRETLFYELDLKIGKKNLTENTKLRDTDGVIKIIQDAMSGMIIDDDDGRRLATFDPAPIEYFKGEGMFIKLILYEFNMRDYRRGREYRHKKN